MVKNILKWLGRVIVVIFLGFIGGCLSPLFIAKIQIFFDSPLEVVSFSDSISIANTYIVFTTFIFTAIAIIVAVASYLFSQEAAKSRQIQEQTLFADLIKSCSEKPEQGKELVSKLLENENVIEHFESVVNEKIDVILAQRCQSSQSQEKDALKKAEESKRETDKLKAMIGNSAQEGNK